MSIKKVAGVACLALVVGGVLAGKSKEDKNVSICEDESSAFYASRQFVERYLKSPSTAEYPSLSDVVIVPGEGCTLKVRAWVDAQNGFGAMIRTNYSMTLTGDYLADSYRATDIVIQ